MKRQNPARNPRELPTYPEALFRRSPPPPHNSTTVTIIFLSPHIRLFNENEQTRQRSNPRLTERGGIAISDINDYLAPYADSKNELQSKIRQNINKLIAPINEKFDNALPMLESDEDFDKFVLL